MADRKRQNPHGGRPASTPEDAGPPAAHEPPPPEAAEPAEPAVPRKSKKAAKPPPEPEPIRAGGWIDRRDGHGWVLDKKEK